MGKRVYGQVALLMAGIVELSAEITLLNRYSAAWKSENADCRVGFYPVYVGAPETTCRGLTMWSWSTTGPRDRLPA